MIAANVEAARLARTHAMPTLYRVHGEPGGRAARGAAQVPARSSASGCRWPRGARRATAAAPEKIGDRPRRRASVQIGRAALDEQAVYQPENIGHFGLALAAYAHFTSPIRRYPDLLVHRGIRHCCADGTRTTFPYWLGAMARSASSARSSERRADEATRDALTWLKCVYMQRHVGEAFDGHRSRRSSTSACSCRSKACRSTAWCTSARSAPTISRATARAIAWSARDAAGVPARRSPARALINVIIDERKIDFELADERRARARPRRLAPPHGRSRDERSDGRLRDALPCARCCTSAARSVRRLLVQRSKSRDDARSTELQRARAGSGHAHRIGDDAARAGPARGQRAASGRVPEIARAAVRSAKARSTSRARSRAAVPPLLLVLDGVQDPHNLGACLRTADAAGATRGRSCRRIGRPASRRRCARSRPAPPKPMPLVAVVNLARTLRWLKERGDLGRRRRRRGAAAAVRGRADRAAWRSCWAREGAGLRQLTRETCDELVAHPDGAAPSKA